MIKKLLNKNQAKDNMFLKRAHHTRNLNAFALAKAKELDEKEKERRNFVKERNMYRTKSRKLQETIDEFVIGRDGIKRIRMEAEAERDKLKEA